MNTKLILPLLLLSTPLFANELSLGKDVPKFNNHILSLRTDPFHYHLIDYKDKVFQEKNINVINGKVLEIEKYSRQSMLFPNIMSCQKKLKELVQQDKDFPFELSNSSPSKYLLSNVKMDIKQYQEMRKYFEKLIDPNLSPEEHQKLVSENNKLNTNTKIKEISCLTSEDSTTNKKGFQIFSIEIDHFNPDYLKFNYDLKKSFFNKDENFLSFLNNVPDKLGEITLDNSIKNYPKAKEQLGRYIYEADKGTYIIDTNGEKIHRINYIQPENVFPNLKSCVAKIEIDKKTYGFTELHYLPDPFLNRVQGIAINTIDGKADKSKTFDFRCTKHPKKDDYIFSKILSKTFNINGKPSI